MIHYRIVGGEHESFLVNLFPRQEVALIIKMGGSLIGSQVSFFSKCKF